MQVMQYSGDKSYRQNNLLKMNCKCFDKDVRTKLGTIGEWL